MLEQILAVLTSLTVTCLELSSVSEFDLNVFCNILLFVGVIKIFVMQPIC